MTPDTAALRRMADRHAAEGWRRMMVSADTVRALCDAADEVERLRGVIAEFDADHVAAFRRGQMRARTFGDYATSRLAAERDASRTAHAALVADLRALHAPRTEVMSGSSDPKHVPMTRQVCSFCGDNYGSAPYPCPTAALLDRHAPEGETP